MYKPQKDRDFKEYQSVYAKLYGRKFVALDDELKYQKGDIIGDGKLSVSDLLLMNRYLAGNYVFTEERFKAADLNGDRKADVFDLIRFRKALLLQ